MKSFLYFELFFVVILGFVVSYKVAEKANITKKVIYTSIQKIEIKADLNNKKDIEKVKTSGFKVTKGSIIKKYGYIFVNNKKAVLGDEVKTGDIIKTASYSHAIIKFSNGGIIRINPNSKLKIDNLETKKDDVFKVNVLLGSILSHFSKKGKFKVNTRTATVGVRGTTFFTEVLDKKNQVVVCACHGNIDFSDNENKYKKYIESDHHQIISLNSKGFVKNIKPLVKDVSRLHNDDSIAELKSLLENNNLSKNTLFDYTYSKNSKTLKKAIDLIENKKGKNAIVVLSKIAKKDAYAAFLVGKILYEGNGVRKNKKTAVKWLKISAKKEFPSAIEYLKSI